MDFDATLTRLENLLGEERSAIVQLDADRIEAFTDEKGALLDALRTAPPPSPEARRRLEALRDGLRHNLALLSHGRACLRETIAAITNGASDPNAQPRTGLRVNVTG
jgi:hypothetical protein